MKLRQTKADKKINIMKKILCVLTMALLLQAGAANAQQPAAPAAQATNGQIVLPDNSTLSGEIKDNIRKKGEVVLLVNGKKTKYTAATISSVKIDNSQYITSNYTFYEVIYQGKNITLLRKASEPSDLQYNGSDAVAVSSEGNIDDLSVKKNDGTTLQLLTKKNIKELLGQTCTATVDATKFDIATIKKAVEDCDNSR